MQEAYKNIEEYNIQALAQVKACNNSKNLLNEIKQIVYTLNQLKEITKKLYNNIIKSIQL